MHIEWRKHQSTQRSTSIVHFQSAAAHRIESSLCLCKILPTDNATLVFYYIRRAANDNHRVWGADFSKCHDFFDSKINGNQKLMANSCPNNTVLYALCKYRNGSCFFFLSFFLSATATTYIAYVIRMLACVHSCLFAFIWHCWRQKMQRLTS